VKRVEYEKKEAVPDCTDKIVRQQFLGSSCCEIQLGRSTQTVTKYRELGKKTVVIKERRTEENN
jgi:hypothetical protein